MQTNFSAEQLASDPQLRNSAQIVRTCVHCGFCTATCPTYLLLGDELDSPRGRIYLIKDMLENGKAASPEVVKHVDRCLSCLACMTTCPSGVHYMHLIDHARAHIETTYTRSFSDQIIRLLLLTVMPYSNRFRLAILLAKLFKPLRPLLTGIPGIGAKLGAMLDLAPATIPARSTMSGPRVFKCEGRPKGRVALLSGCAQPVLDPAINESTIRLLTRHGIEVVLPKGEVCCGALVHHMGRTASSHAFAARNIDAWIAEADKGLDAIIVTASGCGTTIKDYGFMFQHDPAYADKAARISDLAMDITEYLEKLDLRWQQKRNLKVTYHSACSMQHGQKLGDEPKRILRQAGYDVMDVPEGHICCGSAGVYNILQPEIAGRLRVRKVGNILKTKPDVVATGNIGCMTQIGMGFSDLNCKIPIVHTVELIDWATGGPIPPALRDAI